MKKLFYVLCLISPMIFAGDFPVCTHDMVKEVTADALYRLENLARQSAKISSKKAKIVVENIVDHKFEKLISIIKRYEDEMISQEVAVVNMSDFVLDIPEVEYNDDDLLVLSCLCLTDDGKIISKISRYSIND